MRLTRKRLHRVRRSQANLITTLRNELHEDVPSSLHPTPSKTRTRNSESKQSKWLDPND